MRPDPQVRLTPSTPNTPTSSPEPFWPFSGASEAAPNSGQTKPVTRCLDRRAKCQSGTLMGATGGTQTHSRRTDQAKTTPLRPSRIVRVPESNTKYGGKRRKTGVASGPLCRQVSVSPQGFPSEKNCFHRANFGFVRCSQGNYLFWPEGLALARPQVRLRTSGLPCPAGDGRRSRDTCGKRRFAICSHPTG
jgi:hypothetical protein